MYNPNNYSKLKLIKINIIYFIRLYFTMFFGKKMACKLLGLHYYDFEKDKKEHPELFKKYAEEDDLDNDKMFQEGKKMLFKNMIERGRTPEGAKQNEDLIKAMVEDYKNRFYGEAK